MNILVLMPLYKIMDVSCVISLVGFVSTMQHEGHKVKCVFTNGFNAARARKALSLGIVEEKEFDYDYALWLDSDHFYKPDDLFALIETMKKYDLPMISASYKMRGSDQTAAGTHVDGKFKHYLDAELSGDLQECDIVGFGFLVMRKGFMEELWGKYGEDLFVLNAQLSATEDVQFCLKVKESGNKVSFNPQVKVGHVESAIRF